MKTVAELIISEIHSKNENTSDNGKESQYLRVNTQDG